MEITKSTCFDNIKNGLISPRLVFLLTSVLIFLDSLDAYAIHGIPINWIAKVGFVFLAFSLILNKQKISFPYSNILIALIILAFLVTVINNIFTNYNNLPNIKFSGNYYIFILLRFLNLVSFFSLAHVIYWLISTGFEKKLVECVTIIGVIVAIFAFYVCIAQFIDLPQFPRTRIGTGGSAQNLIFSGLEGHYSRALGGFREPSFLAAWLIVPFFFSLVNKTKLLNPSAIIIAAAIFLTWSLSAILSIFLGLFFAFFITLFLIYRHYSTSRVEKFIEQVKWLIPIFLSTIVGLLIACTMEWGIGYIKLHQQEWKNQMHAFHMSNWKVITKDFSDVKNSAAGNGKLSSSKIVIVPSSTFSSEIMKHHEDMQKSAKHHALSKHGAPSNGLQDKIKEYHDTHEAVSFEQKKNVLEPVIKNNGYVEVGDRINNLFTKGVFQSNRSYIFKFLITEHIPFWGYGFGNSNLVLAKYLSVTYPPGYFSSISGQGATYPASFLSLYINFLISTGYIGFFLLLLFIFAPIFKLLSMKDCVNDKLFLFLSAYISWLILLSVNLDELTLMLAIALAFLLSLIFPMNNKSLSLKE